MVWHAAQIVPAAPLRSCSWVCLQVPLTTPLPRPGLNLGAVAQAVALAIGRDAYGLFYVVLALLVVRWPARRGLSWSGIG